jgi:hypothetical protein
LERGTHSDTGLENKVLVDAAKTYLLWAVSLNLRSAQIPRGTDWVSILISNKQIVNLAEDIITDIATRYLQDGNCFV